MPGIDGSSAYWFRASGEVQRVVIRLPEDQQVSGILGASGKDTWVIRAISSTIPKNNRKGSSCREPSRVPVRSEPAEWRNIKGPSCHRSKPWRSVACAAEGKLEAIYVGASPRSSDRFVFATATR